MPGDTVWKSVDGSVGWSSRGVWPHAKRPTTSARIAAARIDITGQHAHARITSKVSSRTRSSLAPILAPNGVMKSLVLLVALTSAAAADPRVTITPKLVHP